MQMKNTAQFRPYPVCDIHIFVKIFNRGREAPAVGRNPCGVDPLGARACTIYSIYAGGRISEDSPVSRRQGKFPGLLGIWLGRMHAGNRRFVACMKDRLLLLWCSVFHDW
jgi:hypothetical protein